MGHFSSIPRLHPYGLTSIFYLNVNTSYMLCSTIGDWYISCAMFLSFDVTVTVLITILAYLEPRNQKQTFLL